MRSVLPVIACDSCGAQWVSKPELGFKLPPGWAEVGNRDYCTDARCRKVAGIHQLQDQIAGKDPDVDPLAWLAALEQAIIENF